MRPNHYRPGRVFDGRPAAPRPPPLRTDVYPDDVYHAQYDHRSRYNPRYDDRRSRSPRDRSPDRLTDRASQYSDGDRRRTSAESRTNASTFQSNRDNFREPLTAREPPRAPKAYLDPPSGPRGGFSGDFRGRGRGRGRGWRDDSRDRGRDRDFRDRRDEPPPFRDDRSRERERDWRDRERDSFRGRRPSPGPRRSPPGRDFRDRDLQIGVEADRARRGSRDGGPLSAGSSASDPPFGSQSYRGGGYRGRGGRGRGDWDRGRGRPSFFDDRGDRFRSRSQEGRWGGGPRDRDERDHRYIDSDVRPRDGPRDDREPPLRDLPRDPRDTRDLRDPVDRNARPKFDRQGSVATEPITTPTSKPTTPPLAPVAPAFGTAPVRPPPASDVSSKAPPTAPRAFTEDRQDRQDRPPSSGQSGGDQWAPPSGPSNSISPTIPTGPRGMQLQKAPRPSSKQWINPALVGGKAKIPESPKVNRSQSFASPQQSRPFDSRTDSYSNRRDDEPRRPRSSGAGAETERTGTDGSLRPLSIPEPGDARIERGTQSARASVDRDIRAPWKFPDLKTGVAETSDRASVASAISPTAVKTTSPTMFRPGDQQDDDAATAQEDGEIIEDQPPKKRSRLHISSRSFELPPKVTEIPTVDQSSDSDDEDMNDYFDSEIAKAESELQRLEHVNNAVPTEIVIRYAQVTHEALVAVATENGSLKDMLGPIPDDIVLPTQKDEAAPETEKSTPLESVKAEKDNTPTVQNASQAAEPAVPAESEVPEPQPKVEEMEVDSSHVPIPTVERPELPEENGDVAMEDAPMNGLDTTMSEAGPLVPNGISAHIGDQQLLLPHGVAPPGGVDTTSPTPVEEEEDETDIEVDDVTLELVRPSMQTPPLEDLPYFNAKPWTKSRQAMSSMEHDTEVEAFISRILQDNSMFVRGEQEAKKLEYAGKYEDYLRFTISDDPVASKSRDAFNKANAPIDGGGSQVAGPEPKPEGRRGGRFATDRDIERIMAQSLLEAREKEERETRAEKLKHPSTSEAVIPDMYWTKEDRDKELFIDHSGFLNPEKLIANWQVLPPEANFTEQEAQLFEKAYLEFPKQWGRIADQIPGRDFHSCIQYYYLKKRELNLKEKLKKQPKKKKSRKTKARSSALVSELGNPDEPQDENAETGENGERRRPRRAAAPTWDFEKPHPESAEGTPAATPARRGAGSKAESGTEKPDKPTRKRRGANKEKEPKQPKTPQVLAPTPQGVVKGARSRSSSKVPPPEFLPSQTPTAEMGRTPLSFDVGRASPMPGLPPAIVPAPPHAMSPADKTLAANATTSANTNSSSNATALLDIMAPPSLRPEPIPPPQSQHATFEFSGHVGSTPHVAAEPPERVGRATPSNANAASSYWSVAEMNNFPELLKSFGTDWQAIAQHMTTKTATMVKNFYNKQTGREKPEWSQIAAAADAKVQRGEKLPVPPTPTAGPRNKRSDYGTHRRAPSVDVADDSAVAKAEKQSVQREQANIFNGRIPVPIAQAPAQQQIRQQPIIGQSPLPERIEVVERQERKPLVSSQPISQALEPAGRHARSSSALLSDREVEPLATQQQAIRQSLKPAPISQAVEQPTLASQAGPSRAGFAAPPELDVPAPFMLGASARQRRPPADVQPKEEPRLIERQPPRLKQEPEQAPHFEPFVPSQAPRPTSTKPVPVDRRPEPPRTTAPHNPQQAFAPVAAGHQMMQREPPIREPLRETMREQQMMAPPADERRVAGVPGRVPNLNMIDTRVQNPIVVEGRTPSSAIVEDPRRVPNPNMEPARVSNANFADTVPARVPNPNMIDTPAPPRVPNPNAIDTPTRAPSGNMFDSAYGASPSRPSPTPSAGAPPPRQADPPKKSNLSWLLNDDPAPAPPAPKRVDEVARGGDMSSSPPPSMSGRGPPPSAAPPHMRREETPTFSPYSRTGPAQNAMPALKPYSTPHTQSPQLQHTGIPRSSMASPIEAATAERDYYGRNPYGAQHQGPPSGSPHQPPHHYSSPSQQSPMVYPGQPAAFPFGAQVTQPHAASPTMQYAHPSTARREMSRDLRESRDPRDVRDPRDPRDIRDPRDLRDSRDPRDTRDPRDLRDPRDYREVRESVPPGRETAWPAPPAQSPSAARLQQEVAWPQSKVSQPPPPAQSPWGSQHAAPSKLQQMRETPQPSWSAAPPPHMSLRESVQRDPREMRDPRDLRDPRDPGRDPRDMRDDPYAVRAGLRESVPPRDPREERYMIETQQRAAAESRMSADPRMVVDPRDPRVMGHPHHQHSHSGSIPSRMYAASPAPREVLGGPPPGPPQAQTPAYPRYATPGPRDMPPRSYTPAPSQQQQQQQQAQQQQQQQQAYEMQMHMREREIMQQNREVREREMRAAEDLRSMSMRPGLRDEYGMDPRARGPPVDLRGHEYGGEFRGELRGPPPQADPRGDPRAVDPLRRQLRPHEGYPGPGDRRY